jgi:hypothetical protein
MKTFFLFLSDVDIFLIKVLMWLFFFNAYKNFIFIIFVTSSLGVSCQYFVSYVIKFNK